MTTTNLAVRNIPGPVAALPLRDLRERRLELRAEQVRSRYLRRLLQAQLDLTVAATVGAHTEERATGWGEGLPVPPTADEVSRLLHWPDDLGGRLAALREALRRMASYEEALDHACTASTAQLVDALAAAPKARVGA